ncbi:MAG TPA: DNA-processing protein DprA [Solirubrobacteraceae bacterium]|nr:DNA-processing protein DprA [Solirubrobacteraceae bacterium]
MSIRLDYRVRDLSRFWSLLELPDVELIEAIGGRRRAELHAKYARWKPAPPPAGGNMETICRHNIAYPGSLREDTLAPHTLSVRGGVERFAGMLDGAVVAIVGTRRASDYGMETARSLARGLAASGVTVASGLAEGIPTAVHSGALEAGDRTLTVMASGVERCSPAWCGALYRRIADSGCAISETPSSRRAHRWCEPARARTLALLAQLVIVVEADEHPWELACARVAQAHRRPVAAVPGRVSSPASSGTNALLMGGARLVRSPQDALDLLYGVGARQAAESSVELEPRLRTVLEQVGNGADTVAKLTAHGAKSADVALVLAELELQGLLVRGDAGRYVPGAGVPVR